MRSYPLFILVSACLAGCAHQPRPVPDGPLPQGRYQYQAFLAGQSIHGIIELVDKVQIAGCAPYNESARQLYVRQQQYRKLTVGCDPYGNSRSSQGTFMTLEWTAGGEMLPDVAIGINIEVTRMEQRGCIRWSQPPVGQPATCLEYQMVPVRETQRVVGRGSITRLE